MKGLRTGRGWIALLLILVGTMVLAAGWGKLGTTGMSTRAGSDPEGVALPILMYHSILKDSRRQGKYVVSPDTFAADMDYLRERGYTTIGSQELMDYVEGGKPLPEKPVMVTLDDGYLNNLTYVAPILQERGMKAVVSVVGAYSQRAVQLNDPNPNYAYLTWEQIRALAASGCVEIGNHSYNMHRESPRQGVRRKPGESLETYREAFFGDIGGLQETLAQHCGITPRIFAYPYGFFSEPCDGWLQEMGFTVTLTCTETLNWITPDRESLLGLGRFNRPAHLSTADYMARMGIH